MQMLEEVGCLFPNCNVVDDHQQNWSRDSLSSAHITTLVYLSVKAEKAGHAPLVRGSEQLCRGHFDAALSSPGSHDVIIPANNCHPLCILQNGL